MSCDTDTHYIASFTQTNERGEQRAVCGEFVRQGIVAPLGIEPTCWGCSMWFEGLERPRQRRLTRHEQLQALADSGCDTWEDARGER